MRQLVIVLVSACAAAACGSVKSDQADAAAEVDAPDLVIDATSADATDVDAAVDAAPCPDTDGDTICNAMDLCPGADDRLDADTDGIPDRCPTNVLVIDGFGSADLATFLRGWGMTVTVEPAINITAAYNFAPYDVITLMYDSAPAAPAALIAAQSAGKGIVVHRGDAIVDDLGMGASGYWQSDMFVVTNNTHFITQTLALGALDLSYDYQSRLNTPTANARVLATGNGGVPALAVHATVRTVITPYYGHTGGMPWSNAGALITWRSYVWAAGRAPL
jgi:hypothetical protein